MTFAVLAGLVATGTVAGLDLASGPQILLARPLVAGTLAGLCLGDPAAGALVGSALELFALEVLPVGAARYPDHGPGAVGAVLTVVLLGTAELWRGIAVGLALAVVGGWSLLWLRRAQTRAVAAAGAALQALEPGVLGRLQRSGLGRDFIRSLGLTLVAIGAGWMASRLPPVPVAWNVPLNAVALGAGAAAALNGAIRSAGRGRRLVTLGAGLIAGTLWAVLA